jgi:hypothetical protein
MSFHYVPATTAAFLIEYRRSGPLNMPAFAAGNLKRLAAGYHPGGPCF